MKKRAVFVDRDGTLIVDQVYARDPSAVRLIPGAAEALVRLRAAGYAIVLISNQAGVGRGIIRPQDVEAVHERMVADLAAVGATLDAAYYCHHAPVDGCPCRKPRPGLFVTAIAEHDLEPGGSFMVGDKMTDIEAARAAGCDGILLASDDAEARPDVARARAWPDAVAWILSRSASF